MQTPKLASDIIRSIVDAVDVPVTAKFRSGWTNEEKNAVDFAKRLEQAGVSLVSVHGRSARQMYRGNADWDVIAQVKEAVAIPVAGSGTCFPMTMHAACVSDVVSMWCTSLVVHAVIRGYSRAMNPRMSSASPPCASISSSTSITPIR